MTPSPMERLDLSQGPDPAYVQVRNHLLHQIDKGVLSPGSQLMPERSLALELGVSRVTVRRSLLELVSEGLLMPSHGRGWFVTNVAAAQTPSSLLGFTESAASQGFSAGSRHLETTTQAATTDQSRALGLKGHPLLVTLERLRLHDGRPVARSSSWLPQRRFRALKAVDLTDSSLFSLLGKEFGVRVVRAEFTVEATPAERAVAKMLRVKEGAPLLTVVQLSFDEDDVAFELSRTDYRPDSYRFRASVQLGSAGKRANPRLR